MLDEEKFCKNITKQIDAIHDELTKIDKEILKVKNTPAKKTAVADTLVRSEARSRILKIKLDSLHKKLNKVWGDKRSTELSGKNGAELFSGLAESLKEIVKR